MLFQPVRVALHDEAEIIQSGLRHMLAPYADRVVVVDGPTATADLVMSDPFAGPTLGAPQTFPRGRRHLPWVVYTWDLRRRVPVTSDLPAPAAYLSKCLPALELVTDLEKVLDGEFLIDDVVPPETRQPTLMALTRREEQVLAVLAEGVSNGEIAQRLQISHNTLKTYIRSAYRKIDVTTRSQAVLWAVDHALR